MAEHSLEWDDVFGRVKFVMHENIAKNSFGVGEFNEFLSEHSAVKQFVRILRPVYTFTRQKIWSGHL